MLSQCWSRAGSLYLLCLLLLAYIAAAESAIYLTLHRRGDPFATHDAANLTRLKTILAEVEGRYSRTQRVVDANRLGRRWKSHSVGTTTDDELINAVGHPGTWVHTMPMSEPLQSIEVDVSMLSPDFYITTTTSEQGSQYNSFIPSHIPSGEHVHPLCQQSADLFHLVLEPGQITRPINLSFALCRPSHSHSLTLSKAGSILGISPENSQLSRITSPSLTTQLHSLGLISHRIFSLTLLTPSLGLLSFGSTAADPIARARLATELELANFGNPLYTPSYISSLVSEQLPNLLLPELEDQFHWLPTSGPRGLWTTLLSGIWVGGSKVLQNQPVLFDINCPFILAPPLAARRFYESIGGAQWIPKSNREDHSAVPSGFWKIPCLNRVGVAWEFRGKMFAAFRNGGREEALFGPAGGTISLGKFVGDDDDGRDGVGTGYCVGILVETTMGSGEKEREEWKNSGMRAVWVLGEPFFRGLGVVFDMDTEGGRIGLRSF